MTSADPDHRDRLYRDALIAVSEPGIARLGSARSAQAAWEFARLAVLDDAPSDLLPAVQLAVDQGFAVTKWQCLELGLSAARIRTLLRRRVWSRPYPGTVSPLPPLPPLPTRGLLAGVGHASAAIGAAAACLRRRDTHVSHACAALMHGLPVLPGPTRPTLTTYRDAALSRRGLQVHTVGLGPLDVTTWYGAPVTSVARTVVDLARTGVAAGLVAADAALADRLVTTADLHAARARMHHRPGIRSADRVIELASPCAESPLESLTRLCLVDGGLPTPELQVCIGPYRVDAFYRRPGVIIEADGELKYTSIDALRAEKRRQEDLEQRGFAVVRVSWADVRGRPDDVVARVRRAIDRQSRLRAIAPAPRT